MISRRACHRVACALLCLLAFPAMAVELRIADDGRTAGYLTLAWDAGEPVELQQRGPTGAWATIYSGPDTATTLSGLPDGDLAFRARRQDEAARDASPWGPVLQATIDHHPLRRALLFFFAGAAMFAILLACIMRPWPTGRNATGERA